MKVDCKIPLEEVHHTYPDDTKLYRGRPEMIVMTMSNGRRMQMFRGGKVQILGPLSETNAENMRLELITKLRKVNTMQTIQATTMTLLNLVMSVQLTKGLRLHKIQLTDFNFFHEVELFPAALIRAFYPVHIAAFHTGKLIFTGLKSVEQFNKILPVVIFHLEEQDVLEDK